MRTSPLWVVHVCLLIAGMLSVSAHGQTVIVPPQPAPWAWPYGTTVMPYWGYWHSPCYPFASCMAYQQFQILERRQERWEKLRRGQESQASAPISAGAPTAPVNDANVKPAYKGSGEYLPEFLDGRVRPGR